MIRQPEREQLNRLTVKTLDQVFIMRVKEGLDGGNGVAVARRRRTGGVSQLCTVLVLRVG